MAQKKKTTRKQVEYREKVDLTKVCAFWGIFLSALLFIARGVLGLLQKYTDISIGGTIIGILDLIAKLALLVGVAFPAYAYVRGRRHVWKVIYWVVLIIYIVGCVFSLVSIS